jgi:DNA-directed RNA polymerase sigma subunit (sigma70/sigma32)
MDKRARVNLGIDLAMLSAKPNQPMSCVEIAAWCGCSKQRIAMIEHAALNKIRRKLHPKSPLLEELKAHL